MPTPLPDPTAPADLASQQVPAVPTPLASNPGAISQKPPAATKPAAGYTATTWAKELLRRLGAPVTSQNVHAIVAWEAAEGGHWNNTAYYNPLNTTINAAGATSMNDVGVKAYTSWNQGLNATVATLKQSNMAGIRNALMSGTNSSAQVAHAIVSSPWGTHAIDVGQNYTTYGTGTVNTKTGTGGGGSSVVSDTTGGGAAATPKPLTVGGYLDNPDIQANYGYLAAFLHDKELGPILAKAAQQGWGQDQLQGALMKTKWWKKTAQSARAWESQQKLDPATAHQRLSQMVGSVQQLAQSTLGAPISKTRASQIANTALAQNWSQAQLQVAVGAEFHYNAATTKGYAGLAGQTLDALKQHASDFLVPLSDKTLNDWTRGILEGTFKDTDFNDYLKTQATSLYPTLKTALDSGVTTKQYLDPYRQMVQQTLGVNPDGLNWMDPKWSKALNTTTPDGQRAPMSLSDWGGYLRGLPEYQYTDEAKHNASDMALNIVQTFGKVG